MIILHVVELSSMSFHLGIKFSSVPSVKLSHLSVFLFTLLIVSIILLFLLSLMFDTLLDKLLTKDRNFFVLFLHNSIMLSILLIKLFKVDPLIMGLSLLLLLNLILQLLYIFLQRLLE